ncbi:MAG: type II secretion system protein [Phycisphaerae bacterium]|nr:type II secretion system protein [Phycisphaerae bacterium]
MIAHMYDAARARRMRWAGRRHRNGFTLIELLVVVSVLAMLIAMLLPSLSAARRYSQRTVCGTNLHSIGLAIQAYLNANRDYYPVIASWPPLEEDKPTMFDALRYEVGASTGATKHEVFRCPSDRNIDGDLTLTKPTYWEAVGTSYQWNTCFDGEKLGLDILTRKPTASRIGVGMTISATPLMLDYRPFHHSDPDRTGSVMALYADFHVEPDKESIKKSG